jgi:ribosomal protein L40E
MPLTTILLAVETLTLTPDKCVTCSPDGLIVAGFIAAVLSIAFLMTAAQNRRSARDDVAAAADTRPRLCRSCNLSHPPFAHYCRRCGRRL